jgi:hypothetical protein
LKVYGKNIKNSLWLHFQLLGLAHKALNKITKKIQVEMYVITIYSADVQQQVVKTC